MRMPYEDHSTNVTTNCFSWNVNTMLCVVRWVVARSLPYAMPSKFRNINIDKRAILHRATSKHSTASSLVNTHIAHVRRSNGQSNCDAIIWAAKNCNAHLCFDTILYLVLYSLINEINFNRLLSTVRSGFVREKILHICAIE